MSSYAPSSPLLPWPDLEVYDCNRAKFTEEQLKPYDGQWVAFSSDGSRLIAGAFDLLELDRLVQQAGLQMEDVWLESILFPGTQMQPSYFPE